ncbi:MAG TPA: hypothetical protein VGU73_11590, partial [Acidimicrobiia bacterium]|nr:hypothetical protein [Acidimicrobiia bacterium]
NGVRAAVVCTPRHVAATHVVVVGFRNRIAALYAYDAQRTHNEIMRDSDGDCASFQDSESPYRTAGGTVGRLFCSHKRRLLVWTYDNVVATATGTGSNLDTTLYNWWSTLVGRTLDPVQEALLRNLPGGIDRTSCQDNGDGQADTTDQGLSIKCGNPTSSIFAVKVTGYPTAAAMSSEYDGLVTAFGLTLNRPPPAAGTSQCSFETTWGSSAADTLGRVFCFPTPTTGLYHFMWTTDSDLTITEAYATSASDVGNFFQTYFVPPPSPNA